MQTWTFVLPLILLGVGAAPLLTALNCRRRSLVLVYSFVIAFAAILGQELPEVHIWTKSAQVLVLLFCVACMLWLKARDDSRTQIKNDSSFGDENEGSRNQGLLFLHSLIFLYAVTLRFSASSPFLWLCFLLTLTVTINAFARLPGLKPLHLLLTIWQVAILGYLTQWQVHNALAEGGLMEYPPGSSLEPLFESNWQAEVPTFLLLSIKQILFSASLTFLAVSVWTLIRQTVHMIAAARLSPGLLVRSMGLGSALGRRFPIPGALLVLLVQAVPLIILRFMDPLVPEAVVLNLSLALSPVIVISALKRSGFGNSPEITMGAETTLARLRRSALHRGREGQNRAS